MTDPKEVVLRHISAFNARDRHAEPWSANAEIVSPPGAVTGRDQVLAFLGVFQEAFPDGQLEVRHLLVDGSAAAVEGAFRGTHNGTLHSPGGDIGATGRSVEFRWAPYTGPKASSWLGSTCSSTSSTSWASWAFPQAKRPAPQSLRSRLIRAPPGILSRPRSRRRPGRC